MHCGLTKPKEEPIHVIPDIKYLLFLQTIDSCVRRQRLLEITVPPSTY
uniref:Uncharacterized protein n=1 Tax=Arundo donax TaxID=35708 RepID=A0A0A9BZ52_ARUDO